MGVLKKLFKKDSSPSKETVPVTTGLPTEVILELTNKCNLRCVMCHIHSPHVRQTRPEGFMDEQLWKKIIDEIALWDHHVHLHTFGGGEALLHPHIASVIAYAKSKQNITAGFLTNGMLLKQDRAVELLRAGIDWIAISLDGTDAEVVEHFRRGSNLKTIEKNIENLIRERGNNTRPHIKLNMVLLPGIEPQAPKFLKKWLPLVDEVMLSTYRPLGVRHFLKTHIERRPCFLLNKMMVIAWNGDVGLCCEDNFIEHSMGNVNADSLKAVWYGKPLQNMRDLHQQGLYNKIHLCERCDSWSTDTVLREFIDSDGFLVKEFTNQKVFIKQ
jgi:radical SAM protein with 4Fe4S-binding SPASM domain